MYTSKKSSQGNFSLIADDVFCRTPNLVVTALCLQLWLKQKRPLFWCCDAISRKNKPLSVASRVMKLWNCSSKNCQQLAKCVTARRTRLKSPSKCQLTTHTQSPPGWPPIDEKLSPRLIKITRRSFSLTSKRVNETAAYKLNSRAWHHMEVLFTVNKNFCNVLNGCTGKMLGLRGWKWWCLWLKRTKWCPFYCQELKNLKL